MKKFALIGIVITACTGPLFTSGAPASAATNPWCHAKQVAGPTERPTTLWPC